MGLASRRARWDNDGSAALNYKLFELVSSDPTDGANDVEPLDLNFNGITLQFSANVGKAAIRLSEGGTDLGWIVSTKDRIVTLKPPRGREIVYERNYEVAGEVEDVAGNKTSVKITFSTKTRTPITVNLLDEIGLAVIAGQYWNVDFDIPDYAQGASLTVDFTVTSGKDVEVYLFDDVGFVNWRANVAGTKPIYASGRVAADRKTIPLVAGSYVLVVSNWFSVLTNKVVRIKASASW